MSIFQVEVIVRAVNIRGNDCREVAAILLVVGPVHDVEHTLGVAVTKVRLVRSPIVNLKDRNEIL